MNKLIKCLVLVLSLVLAQQASDPPIQKKVITFDTLYNVTLLKGETRVYSLKILNLRPDDSLFVETASPIYDPYQIPTVVISSDNFSLQCSEQSNQFLGICQLNPENLKEGQKFDITITCQEKCNLVFQALLSKTYQIPFGQKITIASQKEINSLQYLIIKVPDQLIFTEISLIVILSNQFNVQEGVEMYINIGNQSAPNPSTTAYLFRGSQIWGNGVGFILSNKQITAGQWIKLLLVLGQGVQAQFYSQSINENTYRILLNTQYRDFLSEDGQKLYILDTSDLFSVGNLSINSNLNIEITFMIYSGYPLIKVAFDPQFKSYLSNSNVEGTFSYIITAEIRQKYNYTDSIYILVSSFWSSNYLLHCHTFLNKGFIKLFDGINQISTLQSQEIQNYIYESYISIDNNQQDTTQSYKLQLTLIDLDSGAQVGIRRCLSLEKNGTFDCLIYNISDMSNKDVQSSFDQINATLRKDLNVFELWFEYNALTCTLYQQFQTEKMYNCQFHIVVFPANKVELKYSITMFQNLQEATLRQSYFYRDVIHQQIYHYYDFTLPDDLSKIDQVTFFMTIISGDAVMLGTTNSSYKFMELGDLFFDQDNVQYSSFNTLTFNHTSIRKQFYIGIYAIQSSDITVSVAVKRFAHTDDNKTSTKNSTGDKTETTTLTLTQGISTQHTLTQLHSSINFSFTAKTTDKITVQIIQIQGSVAFTVTNQQNGTAQNCTNQIQSGQLKCVFLAEKSTQYRIEVKGDEKEIQIFEISYFSTNVCKRYPFNLPQFVFLAANQKSCSSFSIIDLNKSLQIVTSLSTLDFFTADLLFNATFNDGQSVSFKQRQKLFFANQLQDFCKSSSIHNCIMKLQYLGDLKKNQKFYFVVEQVGNQMVLFDGIVRRVVDQKMSQTKGKFFYYELISMNDSVEIFTTNQDNVGYYIGVKFVEIAEFTASPNFLYLSYREDISQPLKNSYETHLVPQKGASLIQIEPDKFSQSCSDCVMLISVFGLKKQSSQANDFQIQVTQKEGILYLGERQNGILSENEVYAYEVYGNPISQSLLTIRDYFKQSDKESNCFSASVSQIGKKSAESVVLGQFLIPKSTSTYKVYLQNTRKSICSYQISYSSLATPISEITHFMPIEIKINNNQTMYFLHYHQNQSFFKIINYIKSGDLKIFANQINSNNSIQNLIEKNSDLYDFKSLPGDSFLEISNKTKFCANCYFFIAIRGDPNVQALTAITLANQPIGLVTYGLLKQTLKKGQRQTYFYHSIFDFNLSVSLMFGEVNLTINTPKNTTFYSQAIQKSVSVFVPKPKLQQGQFIDYFNDNSKFGFIIQAIKDCSFYISVKKKNINFQVYEGIPMTITIEKEQKVLEFVNVNTENNITILLQDKNSDRQSFSINVSAEVMKLNEVTSNKIDPPVVKKSEGSLNYEFKSIKGTYFITLNSDKNITVEFILVKKKMTHLMSSKVNLFAQKGTFQIYTPGNNLMIVVDTCMSEVQVRASEKYSKLKNSQNSTNNGFVLLEHANYGGHYIITAENVEGEYFVEVNPKYEKDVMEYKISYFYYNKSDEMPYKKVDIDPSIIYQLQSNTITFILKPVRKLSSKQKFKIIPTYILYISNNSNTTLMNSKCDRNLGYSVSQTTGSDNQQLIKFPIPLQTISEQVGPDNDVYYVSAKVKIKFEGESIIQEYAPYIDLAYTKLQLTQSTHIIYKTQTISGIKYILVWIVVPVIISLLLLLIALKFCINKYRMLSTSTLVEEDLGESEYQLKNSKQMNPAESLTNT